MREKNKYGFIPIFMSCLVLWSTNTGNDLMTWSSLVGEQKLLNVTTTCWQEKGPGIMLNFYVNYCKQHNVVKVSVICIIRDHSVHRFYIRFDTEVDQILTKRPNFYVNNCKQHGEVIWIGLNIKYFGLYCTYKEKGEYNKKQLHVVRQTEETGLILNDPFCRLHLWPHFLWHHFL